MGNIKKFPRQQDAPHKPKKAITIGLIVVLVIVVFSFVLGPVARSSRSRSPGSIVFGSYAGRPIENRDGSFFNRRLSLVSSRWSAFLQSADAKNTARIYRMIFKTAYDAAVRREAVLHAVEKDGITIPDGKIDSILLEQGVYNRDGRFDKKVYLETPVKERMRIRNSVRDDLLEQQFQENFPAPYLNRASRDFILNMGGDRRRFRYVVFRDSLIPDEEYRRYGEKKKDLFTRLSLDRITLKKEKTSRNILKELKNKSKTFSEAARDFSSDVYASKGGKMDPRYYHNFVSELGAENAKKLLNLKKEGLTDILKTDYGWMIFRRRAEQEAPDFRSSDVLDEVKQYIRDSDIAFLEDYLEKESQKFLKESRTEGFEEAAARWDLPLKETKAFPLNYGRSSLIPESVADAAEDPGDRSYFSAALSDEDFYKALFSLKKEGDLTDPIFLDKAVFVFSLEGIVKGSPQKSDTENLRAVIGSRILRDFGEEALKSPLHKSRFERGFNEFSAMVRGPSS